MGVLNRRVFCACGCGRVVKPGNTYINHHGRGKPLPKVIPNHHPCACGCGELVASDKRFKWGHNGGPPTKETRNKISKTLAGHDVPLETRNKIAKTLTVTSYWRTEKYKILIKLKREQWRKDNPNYLNGKAIVARYPLTWTEELKDNIRELDNFCCVICGKEQTKPKHDVHHIDYNRCNLDICNLVTLCKSCHMKTNANREYWKSFFKDCYV